jgi:hypothetical protein
MIFDTYRRKRKANRTTRSIYAAWLGKNVTVNVGGHTVVSDKLIGYNVDGDRLVLNFAGGSNVTNIAGGANVTNIAGGQPPTHIWCDDVRRAA